MMNVTLLTILAGMTTPSRYVHGTAPEEQARLSALNALINERCLRILRLVPGESIVDFGSGLGQMTRLMARTVGAEAATSRPHVVGIERSLEQLDEARRQAEADGEADLVEFRQGDVDAPPLADDEWATFDVAHARFLLEHVPDPVAVVRRMLRVVRPGGRVLLLDDDHEVLRLWPEVPGLDTVWRAYMRTYDRLGNDPIVGRRLVEILHAAGARPVRNDWAFFGASTGDPSFGGFVENLAGVLEGARDGVLETGGVSAPAFEAAVAAVRAFGTRPDAAIWYAVAFAEGVRGGEG
jgi:ubiquinone/menaquinone biosynthesis C-methylase UbiE